MKTQTVYVPVDNSSRFYELYNDGKYLEDLEKKDNMIVMSLEELEKVIGNAFIAGENCESLCRRGYQSEAVPRKQYISNLLNK